MEQYWGTEAWKVGKEGGNKNKEKSSVTTMWRVVTQIVVHGRVMWGHPSTNHNSSHGEFWHKLCIFLWH